MNIPAIPTSSVGTLPTVLTMLEADVKKINDNPNDASYKQYFVAHAIGSVAVAFFALVDEVIHTACVAVKAVPVAFRYTIGKVTGLDKYFTSPALTGEDFVGHLKKIYACFLLQVLALPVAFGVSPDSVISLAKKWNVLPTGQDGNPAKDLAPGSI